MEIITKKLSELKPAPWNPRYISDEAKAGLAASIKEFDIVEPIIWNKQSGHIVGGHQRFEVLKERGDTLTDVVVVDLSEEKEKALNITLNNQNITGDFTAGLELVLNDIKADLPDLYDCLNLDALLADIPEPPEPPTPPGDPDKVPDVAKEPVIKTGDLITLGKHRILCGDSTKKEDVERLMQGNKADMVFTDPPYNVDYEGNYIQSGKILKKKEKIWQGGIANDNLDNFGEWLCLVYRTIDCFMSEGCAIYIWHPSGEDAKYFWGAWPFDVWHFQVDLIWNKLSLIISRWDYKPQHEPCMYGWKGKNRIWMGANNESTVWDVARQQGSSGEKRVHPTQKPIILASKSISNHTNAKGIVLDPFLGSGSTLIACETTNRTCRGIEIDPGYIQVCTQRWIDFTGRPEDVTVERDGKECGWEEIQSL